MTDKENFDAERFFHPAISLDSGSREPRPEQLFRQLSTQLKRLGPAGAGRPLLPERRLAEELKVDRTLVHKIYQKLQAEGLLERPPGGRRYLIVPSPCTEAVPKALGILLPRPFSEYFNGAINWYMRRSFYSGIVDRATELAYSLRILSLPRGEVSQPEAMRTVRAIRNEVRGVVHFGELSYEREVGFETLLAERELPQVFLAAECRQEHVGVVGYDEEQFLNELVQYLKETAHRRLALVQPLYERHHIYCHYDLGNLLEYVEPLRARGVEIRDEWLLHFNDFCAGKKLADMIRRAIDQPKGPTIFLCHDDETVFEVIKILGEERVPRDFSVIGIFDQPECRTSEPSLTSFQLPFYECGRRAVEMLHDGWQNGIPPEKRRLKLPVRLMTRASVASLRPILALVQ